MNICKYIFFVCRKYDYLLFLSGQNIVFINSCFENYFHDGRVISFFDPRKNPNSRDFLRDPTLDSFYETTLHFHNHRKNQIFSIGNIVFIASDCASINIIAG